MKKTTDELLFEALMRAPAGLRRRLTGAGPMGGHRCRRMEGGRPMEGRGCNDGRTFGHGPMHGHGPMEGPGPMHGHSPMRGHGPMSRERVLHVLMDMDPEGVRQKTLGEALRLSPSTVSEMIERLKQDGYLERTVDPADKRATLVRLTDLGRARVWEQQDERAARFAALFSNLEEAEKLELIRLLQKLSGPATPAAFGEEDAGDRQD